jgi:hypothetical protein
MALQLVGKDVSDNATGQLWWRSRGREMAKTGQEQKTCGVAIATVRTMSEVAGQSFRTGEGPAVEAILQQVLALRAVHLRVSIRPTDRQGGG